MRFIDFVELSQIGQMTQSSTRYTKRFEQPIYEQGFGAQLIDKGYHTTFRRFLRRFYHFLVNSENCRIFEITVLDKCSQKWIMAIWSTKPMERGAHLNTKPFILPL